MKREPFRLSDIYVAAYLSSLGLNYSLERKGRKILFSFHPTPELYKGLQAYNEGSPVSVDEFVVHIKRLRAQMYEAKDDTGYASKDRQKIRLSDGGGQ